MKPSFSKWLKDISLTKKLYFVVGIMALLIMVELVMLSFMIHTLSSARALVGAEGLWSKAQKDAVYNLTKYGYTRDEGDYHRYLNFLGVPMGDRRARLELLSPHPVTAKIREGFIAGRVHPDDIDGCINLLTRFHNISYIRNAIIIWTDGDNLLNKLQDMGARLHAEVTPGQASPEEIRKTQLEIYQINEQLTLLEDKFSFTLGEGSRWIEGLILTILFSIALTVESIGLFMTFSVSRSIAKGIGEVIRIAGNIARADFSDRAKVFSKDEIGTLAGSFNKMTDDLEKKIKEEREALESLRKQQDLYETLINTSSDMGEGILISEGQKIMYVNDAVCTIYGYSKEEILRFDSFMAFVAEEEKPTLLARLKKRMTEKTPQNSGETKIKRKDGKIICIEYSVRNIFFGGRVQMLSIIRDVTDKKIAAELLQKETQRSESAEAARKIGEQFLANMSHEIRTPMNAILGFTDIILKTKLTNEQYEYMEAIKLSGDNLLVIINDILDLSRMRSGKMPIEHRKFSLSKQLSLCTELMKPKAAEKGLKISVIGDPFIPDHLIGDATRLNQVLLNLISNAIKFTSKGEVTIEAKLIDVLNDDINLEFSVRDSGIGIAKDKIASIFEAFTQANNATARTYGGTGLGLAIVKQLADLQGGSVHVSSEENKGSCFYFRIGYKINRTSEQNTENNREEHPHPIRVLKILLVEDNTLNQLLANKVLSDWGWDVVTVENGAKAIEQMQTNSFDLVLMDIQMPEMDGYETTLYIRNHLPAPKSKTPILAMTANVMASEENKCYESGMDDYISKPFDVKVLYDKIASLVK